MYNIDGEMNAIQKILIADATILKLLDLTDKPPNEIARRIIKRSKWDDLVSNEKRLCAYPLPSRPTGSEILFEELIEVDCHVPAIRDYEARQIIGRVVDIMKMQRINGRPIHFKGKLGELPTMSGFYCFGVRFSYYNPV